MMAAKVPKLDSLLECPICLSECEDPRVLTCLHTLCLKCLDQHINTSAEGNHFFCPSCRHKCEVPAGGVTSVAKNFFLNSLKAILQQHGSQKKSTGQFAALQTGQHECSNSGKGDIMCEKATVFCVDCAQFYCPDCQSYHSRFQDSSNHQLVPVSSADANVIKAAVSKRTTPRCDQHSTLPTDMYCETCRVPVCMKCCVLKHKQHNYREIKEAAENSRVLLSDLTETAKNISSRLQKSMQELDVSEESINKDCDEACRQVQENAEEIRALVTQREKTAVQEIGQAKTTALAQLKATYKEAEISKAAIESLLSYIQALLESEDVTSQVVHTPGLQEQLRQREMATPRSVTLEVNLEKKIQSLSALKAMLAAVNVRQTTETRSSLDGTVSTGSRGAHSGTGCTQSGDSIGRAVPTVTRGSLGGTMHIAPTRKRKTRKAGIVPTPTTRGILRGGVPDKLKKPLGSPLLKLEVDVGDKAISGLVVMNDCICVTGDEQPYLLIHNMNTNIYNRHTLYGLKARGMASLHGDTLVITDRSKKLHLVKTDRENEMTKHVVKNIPFEPYGVTVDTARNKLVVANRTHNAIVICDSKGNVESQVRGVGYLTCATATSVGYVVNSSDRVKWLSRGGDVLHIYYHIYLSLSQSVVDSLGRVIIADNNYDATRKLHLIDAQKNFSHDLLSDKHGIHFPTRVYLDEVNARLYLGWSDRLRNNLISVFKWPFIQPSSSRSRHAPLC